MKKVIVYSSIATTFIASATAISGVLLSNKLMYIKQKDVNFIIERETKAKRIDKTWYEQCPKEDLLVESPNGYFIKGIFLKPLETPNTIIFCHGVTENKISSMKYAPMFASLGFNTVVYDQRRHGESGGKTTSYGHYEKFDLQAIVQEVRKLTTPNAILGIHGESMGAATTLLYAGTIADEEVTFYIVDSAYSDLKELLYKIVQNSISIKFKLPVHITDLALRLRDGYSISNIVPKEVIPKIPKPVLFIHNVNDTFIPSYMTEEMYELKEGNKMLQLFDKGDHTQAFNENPYLYKQTVKKFLATCTALNENIS